MGENGLKPKGIFLDLDGTIVDSTEAYLEAARFCKPSGKNRPQTRRLWKFRAGLSRASR